jgi:hypothetical protein
MGFIRIPCNGFVIGISDSVVSIAITMPFMQAHESIGKYFPYAKWMLQSVNTSDNPEYKKATGSREAAAFLNIYSGGDRWT